MGGPSSYHHTKPRPSSLLMIAVPILKIQKRDVRDRNIFLSGLTVPLYIGSVP